MSIGSDVAEGTTIKLSESSTIVILNSDDPEDLVYSETVEETPAEDEKVLEEIKLFDILTDGGIIIVETRKNKILPAMDYPLRLIKEYEYGSVKISKFSKEART